MRKKIKALGMDFTPRQYITQIVIIAGFAAAIGYMYFYSLLISTTVKTDFSTLNLTSDPANSIP